eukprot:TRINITY_DN2621_c0_g1_i7.p1 TRINITY_DN2621_c0_g1~~TRINITY_DN2621_c0_g1_i7.p1  ORF type:complete len:1047 (+),score=296.96 TRINITY_DN2621_c0_g1_i7:27-3143(+)
MPPRKNPFRREGATTRESAEIKPGACETSSAIPTKRGSAKLGGTASSVSGQTSRASSFGPQAVQKNPALQKKHAAEADKHASYIAESSTISGVPGESAERSLAGTKENSTTSTVGSVAQSQGAPETSQAEPKNSEAPGENNQWNLARASKLHRELMRLDADGEDTDTLYLMAFAHVQQFQERLKTRIVGLEARGQETLNTFQVEPNAGIERAEELFGMSFSEVHKLQGNLKTRIVGLEARCQETVDTLISKTPRWAAGRDVWNSERASKLHQAVVRLDTDNQDLDELLDLALGKVESFRKDLQARLAEVEAEYHEQERLQRLAAAEDEHTERQAALIAETGERTTELEAFLAREQAENVNMQQTCSDLEKQLEAAQLQLASETSSFECELKRAQDAERISVASDEKIVASERSHTEREEALNALQEHHLRELQDVMAKEQAEHAAGLRDRLDLEQRLENAEFQLSGTASSLEVALKRASDAGRHNSELVDEMTVAERAFNDREAKLVAQSEERVRALHMQGTHTQAKARMQLELALQQWDGSNAKGLLLETFRQWQQPMQMLRHEKLAAHTKQEAALVAETEERARELEALLAKEQAENVKVQQARSELEEQLQTAQVQLASKTSSLESELKRARDAELISAASNEKIVASERSHAERVEALNARQTQHLNDLQDSMAKEQAEHAAGLRTRLDLEQRLENVESQLSGTASSLDAALKRASDAGRHNSELVDEMTVAERALNDRQATLVAQSEERVRALQIQGKHTQAKARMRLELALQQWDGSNAKGLLLETFREWRQLMQMLRHEKLAVAAEKDHIAREAALVAETEERARELTALLEKEQAKNVNVRQAHNELEQQLQTAEVQLISETRSFELELKRSWDAERTSTELDEELTAAEKNHQALEAALIEQQEAFRDSQALLAKERDDRASAQRAHTDLEQRLQNAEATLSVMAQQLESRDSAASDDTAFGGIMDWVREQLVCARRPPSAIDAGLASDSLASSARTPAKASKAKKSVSFEDGIPSGQGHGEGGETGST